MSQPLHNPRNNYMHIPAEHMNLIKEEAYKDAGNEFFETELSNIKKAQFVTGIDIDGYAYNFDGKIIRTKVDMHGDGIYTPKDDCEETDDIKFSFFECIYLPEDIQIETNITYN